MSYKVLLVDDDENILDVCTRYLKLEGYDITIAKNGEEALKLFHKVAPHVVVLDVMMPIKNGWDIGEAMRQEQDTPIIYVTALGQEHDRLYGLSLGADDYMVKPFSPKELVLRIQNIIRRVYGKSERKEEKGSLLKHQHLTLDLEKRQVHVAGKEVELTVKEFELLALFMQHPQKVFSKSQLLEKLWGYEYMGDANTINVHVRRLREKMEENPSKPAFIHTVWGIGYKFEGNRHEA